MAPTKKARPTHPPTSDKPSVASLALIMDTPTGGPEYDQREILKREKKALKQKQKRRKQDTSAAEAQDTFDLDVEDKRFSAALESYEFAIDPTNPQ